MLGSDVDGREGRKCQDSPARTASLLRPEAGAAVVVGGGGDGGGGGGSATIKVSAFHIGQKKKIV